MLGTKVKDKITGFTGVVTGYVTYLSGCNQVLVNPPVGEDGASRESLWLDEQRVERIDDSLIVLDNGDHPGFDAAPPKR